MWEALIVLLAFAVIGVLMALSFRIFTISSYL
jgi:hypothetical protein